MIESITDDTFHNCISLTSVDFPAATTIGSEAFRYCRSLTSISVPKVTLIGSCAFEGCSNLTSISLPELIAINDNGAFSGCRNLTSIYLLASSVCKLSNSNAFYQAGITNNRGSIYVHPSLVNSYKNATNWAYFANRIFPYEGE
jgi:hypothetical protein